MQKILLFLLTLLLINPLFIEDIQALSDNEIKEASDINLDISFAKSDENYTTQSQIVLVPIFPTNSLKSVSDEEWFKGIYYYTVETLGFIDIPFHYVIGKDGTIYKGNIGGDERRILIEGLGDDSIVVGYLADMYSTKFDLRSIKKIKELLSSIANSQSISPDNILISGIKFVRDTENLTVRIQNDVIFGTWDDDLTDIKKYVEANYKPTNKEYSIEVLEVIAPSTEFKPGEEVEISVKLKNTGINGVFADTNSEIILTYKDGSLSKFFLNNEWASQTQIKIMQDGEDLPAGTERTFKFKVKTPLFYGTTKESFSISNISKTGNFKSATVDISLNVVKGTEQIVQINPTEIGYLRVRSEPSSVATEVSKATSGERYFLLEDAGNGWVKIQIDKDTSGWVASWYLTYI